MLKLLRRITGVATPVSPDAPSHNPSGILAGTDVGTKDQLCQAFAGSVLASALSSDAVATILPLPYHPSTVQWIAQTGAARMAGEPAPQMPTEMAEDLLHAVDALHLGEDLIAEFAAATPQAALAAVTWAESRLPLAGPQAAYKRAVTRLAANPSAPCPALAARLNLDTQDNQRLCAALIYELVANPTSGHSDLLHLLLNTGPQTVYLLADNFVHNASPALFNYLLSRAPSLSGSGLTSAAMHFGDAPPYEVLEHLDAFETWFHHQFNMMRLMGCTTVESMHPLAVHLYGIAAYAKLTLACITAGDVARLNDVFATHSDSANLLAAEFAGQTLLAHIAATGDSIMLAQALARLQSGVSLEQAAALVHEALEATLLAGHITHAQWLAGWLRQSDKMDAFCMSPAFRRSFAAVAAGGDIPLVQLMARWAKLPQTFAHVVNSCADTRDQLMFDSTRAVYAAFDPAVERLICRNLQRVFPTPLAAAARMGRREAVVALLDIVTPARAGAMSALHDGEALAAAAEGGDIDVMNCLIDAMGEKASRDLVVCAQINGSPQPFYSLELAMREGHMAAALRLLDLLGASAVQNSGHEVRLLAGAAETGDVGLVNAMIDALGGMAQVDRWLRAPGGLVLHAAIFSGQPDVLDLLTADMTAPEREDFLRGSGDWWPLVQAGGDGNAKMLQHLMSTMSVAMPAEAFAADEGVIFHVSKSGDMSLVRNLYTRAQKVDLTEDAWQDADSQALRGLLQGEHAEEISTLLSIIGPARMAHAAQRESCLNLHLAVAQDDPATVNLLLQTIQQTRGSQAVVDLVRNPAGSAFPQLLQTFTKHRPYVLGRGLYAPPTDLLIFAHDARSHRVSHVLSQWAPQAVTQA